eukprot:FR743587.1.p2 GENE.FR743587.1~~FR743587.1.p2  ORF type:complete len:137 (+),score=9.77 FR743587.1:441-851(+)
MGATPITTTITTPRSDKGVPPSVGVQGEGLGCRVGNDEGLGRVVGEAVGALDWPSVLGEAVGKGLGAGVGCLSESPGPEDPLVLKRPPPRGNSSFLFPLVRVKGPLGRIHGPKLFPGGNCNPLPIPPNIQARKQKV